MAGNCYLGRYVKQSKFPDVDVNKFEEAILNCTVVVIFVL